MIETHEQVSEFKDSLDPTLDEARILQIAHAYEQSTDWHKARPPITASGQKT